MPPDLPTATFALPSHLTDPLTCSSCCKRRNEPLPSPTDPIYIDLVKGLRSAFPWYLHVHIDKCMYPEMKERLSEKVKSHLQQIIDTTQQPLKIALLDQYCAPIFPSPVLPSETDDFLFLPFINCLLELWPETDVADIPTCLHYYFETNGGSSLLARHAKTAYIGNTLTRWHQCDIDSDLVNWTKNSISRKKLKGSVWSLNSRWEKEMIEVAHGVRNELERIRQDNIDDYCKPIVGRFTAFVSMVDPIKLLKMLSEVTISYRSLRPGTGDRLNASLARGNIVQLLPLFQSPVIFRKWYEPNELDSDDDGLSELDWDSELLSFSENQKEAEAYTESRLTRLHQAAASVRSRPTRLPKSSSRKGAKYKAVKLSSIRAQISKQVSDSSSTSSQIQTPILESATNPLEEEISLLPLQVTPQINLDSSVPPLTLSKESSSNLTSVVDRGLSLETDADYDDMPGLDDASDTDSDGN